MTTELAEQKTWVKTKRVLVVDDHPVCRRGIMRILAEEPDIEVCAEATSTDEAMQLIQDQNPDLVIVDLSLRDSSGIDLIKVAKSRYGQFLKMIVISMYEEAILVERSIRAGARGYVTKREAAEHLVSAMRSVLEGHFYLSEITKEKALRNEFKSGRSGNSIDSLSDRELEIFQLIGEGLTTNIIAKNLHLSVKTVEGYRANIRTKLDLKDNLDLIHYAVKWIQAGERC